MSIEISNIESIKIFDKCNGKEIMDLSNVSEIQLDCDLQELAPQKSNQLSRRCLINSTEMSFSCLIDSFGTMCSFPPPYDISYVAFSRVRRHKKKRIDKKWLKRYGYKFELRECKGWKIRIGTDGSITYEKE